MDSIDSRPTRQRKGTERYDPSSQATSASTKPKKRRTGNETKDDIDPLWHISKEEFVVKAILEHKKVANDRNLIGLNKYEFKVRWAGYSAASDGWVPYKNIELVPDLQAYITEHPQLKSAMIETQNGDILQDSERFQVIEMKAADLLKAIRENAQAIACHENEEECFRITFLKCTFHHFMTRMQAFHHSDASLRNIEWTSWCPESVFEVFLRTCVNWAQHESTKCRVVERAEHNLFSDVLLGADFAADCRLETVKFAIGPTAAPFHVLGNRQETETPFRQSVKPWYLYLWQKQQSVQLPDDDDDPFSTGVAVTTVVGCRMVVGMMTITYHRKNQALHVTGKYCDVTYSRSYLGGRVVPLRGDKETVKCVHPTIYNKAMLGMQDLDSAAARQDTQSDSE